ncbi:Lauroyl/myristoyl acyltransferase [Serratia marcescens]|uniref:ABC transporter n=1 Tax=Serratia marcescens TaxID=615 RepID=UPI00217AC10D|nr:ABC transporter [Serratia marcescens]CAI1112533.1 Lauroyl/myristoyl acyltransferase [Serratia marcescens]CAI1123870.1 Lauroyl/myristoyl acyltransferase [Serratia marcescens]CAI1837039.1 Lauroyl/myristoyl acyltransferase [Serratia marcescens]CAI1971940.1 Lauroyl/myristoyl acyltransferase [Serratia marcescens]
MRLLAVRGYLAWRNGLDAVARFSAAGAGMGNRLTCALLRRVDYRLWLAVCRRLRGSRPQRRFRHRHAVALANRQSLLGEGKLDFAWLMQRRQWLDVAAVYARNTVLMNHLADCSAQLDRVVAPLHRAGVPVLLAPMHTVSDVLATLVGAGVYPGRATVIVSGDVQEFARRSPENEWRQRLDYCSIHDDPRHIAGTLSQAMLEAAEHRRNIILFPDITPDYTLNGKQDAAAKLACHLFGRPAHLHSGIVRLSRALRAQVVCYSLYFDRGIRIHIEEPIVAEQVGRAMPAIVERTLRQHADDWLLWHSHSLFFINE